MSSSHYPSHFALTAPLRKYFGSGWTFLIPYLAAYLLYYVLKWPVNPVAATSGKPAVGGQWAGVPSLLHVYWMLHAITSVIAAIALCAWWRERCEKSGDGCKILALGIPDSESAVLPEPRLAPLPSRFPDFPIFGARFRAFLPWLLLALLFYIPGVYLDFPADPWEHFARINEWSWLHAVGEHTTWAKSSYFLAYSLLGRITPPTRQIFWLDFYYTGCCLLLCWQYYRLARAVGLGERASFIVVLVQTLTFGNNIFGFYRYYGISSSIFAQLGAVGLTRIAIEYASQKFQISKPKFQGNPAEISHEGTEGMATAQLGTPAAHEDIASDKARPTLSYKPKALSAALSAACLLALTAFNHVQGLGIAGLGLLAVVVWRLIEWKRSMVFWLAAAAIALSIAAILWWPRNPALDAAYRPVGWLTAWYGFNLFSPSSPAFDRMLQILGLFGVVNFAAGLVLLRRNHVAGWLTVFPILALCLPFISIPFASALAQYNSDWNQILTFHRMLLALPVGLALVALGAAKLPVAGHGGQRFGHFLVDLVRPFSDRLSPLVVRLSSTTFRFSISACWVGTLAALAIVSAQGPFNNRCWNVLMRPPEDLSMAPITAVLQDPAIRQLCGAAEPRVLTTPGHGYVAVAEGYGNVACVARLYWTSSPARIERLLQTLTATADQKTAAWLLVPPSAALQSPLSLSGYLSGHWPPQEAVLEYAAGSEIEAAAGKLGGRKFKTAAGTYYLFGNWKAP